MKTKRVLQHATIVAMSSAYAIFLSIKESRNSYRERER